MIVTKFEVGDKVWVADYERVNVRVTCPDCLGTRVWSATLPSGEQMNIPCPTCGYGYEGSRGYVVGPYVYGPKVWQGTIGSVGADPFTRDPDERIRYMMNETGVGSGSVYYEPRVFATEAEAMVMATIRAVAQTKQMEDQYINELKRKKKDRPGSFVTYLRGQRTQLLKQVAQLESQIARLGTRATPEVK